MNRLAFFSTGFGLGLIAAIALGRDERVLHDVALRPFLLKEVSYSGAVLVDSDGDRKTIAQGDTVVLPVWKHE